MSKTAKFKIIQNKISRFGKGLTIKTNFGQMELKKKIENYGNSPFSSTPPFFPCKNYDPPPQSFLVGWGVCINLFCIGNFCIRSFFLNCEEKIGRVVAGDHTYRV